MWVLNPPVLREQFQTLISLLYLDWAVQWALRGTLQTTLSLYNPPVCRAFHHKNSPPFGDLHLMSVVWAAGWHLYQVRLFVGQRVTTGSPASPSPKKEQKHPNNTRKPWVQWERTHRDEVYIWSGVADKEIPHSYRMLMWPFPLSIFILQCPLQAWWAPDLLDAENIVPTSIPPHRTHICGNP